MGPAALSRFSLTHRWHTGNKFILVAFAEPAKLTPLEFSVCHMTSASLLPRCHETLCHFKIIFLASNFTLGYTQVQHESSHRFKHLFQALFRSWFRGDKVLMNRQPDAFWLGSLKDLLSAHLQPPNATANRPRVAQGRTNEPHHWVQSS